MDARRSRAYTRAMTTIADLSATKLHPGEQSVLRDAADALLFAVHPADEELRAALAAADELVDRLVDSGRLLEETGDRLVAELEGCGPLLEAAA